MNGDAIGALLTLIGAAMTLAAFLAAWALVAALSYVCLIRIPPDFRELEPAQAFLLIIPCFNLFWNFRVLPGVARSFQNYFRALGRSDVGDCGERLGKWYAVAFVGTHIPVVQFAAGPASLVLALFFFIRAFQLRAAIPEKGPGPFSGP